MTTDEAEERWAPIPGREGSYEVSTCGRVRSVDRVILRRDGQTRRLRGRLLSQHIRPDGYVQVSLRPGNPPDYGVCLMHHLVLETFVGSRPEGMFGLHKDDVGTNNHLSNLRWGTPSDNLYDCVANGHHAGVNKEACGYGHLLAEPNLRRRTAEEGRRGCLACHRARSTARFMKQHGLSYSLDALRAEHYARIMGDAPADQRVGWAVTQRHCDECGELFAPKSQTECFCSRQCCIRVGSIRGVYLARRRKLPAKRIPHFATFSRDDWTCFVCGSETQREIDGTGPQSPTFLHVVPLDDPSSPGHVPENIKTVHNRCLLRVGESATEVAADPARASWEPREADSITGRVLEFLRANDRPTRIAEIEAGLGLSGAQARSIAWHLKDKGEVQHVRRGVWRARRAGSPAA